MVADVPTSQEHADQVVDLTNEWVRSICEATI